MKDLTKGKPSTLILSFALPVFLGNLLQLTYSLADTRIVGSFLKEDALAAVGASYPITVIFMAFAVGSNLGASVVVSRLFGAGDLKRMKSAVSTAFIACGVLSAVLTLFGWFFCSWMMELVHTPENIFSEGELRQEATVAKFATVQTEGNRSVSRDIEYYNLDVIISVGYRVKSLRGTQFRIWASSILKEYMKKGFALDDERLKRLGGGNYFDELLSPVEQHFIESIRELETLELSESKKCIKPARTKAGWPDFFTPKSLSTHPPEHHPLPGFSLPAAGTGGYQQRVWRTDPLPDNGTDLTAVL